MLKNIATPPSSQIPISTFRLKNAPNMAMKTSFDFDFDPRIKTRASTRRTFILTQHKSWDGTARARQVLEESVVVHTSLQQSGFLAMSGIKLQQLDSHLRLTLQASTTQKIFLILNLRPMMKKITICTH
jgi:hypothetical protein